MPQKRRPFANPLTEAIQTGMLGAPLEEAPGEAEQGAKMPQSGNNAMPQYSNAALPQSSNTVIPQRGNTVMLQSSNNAMPQYGNAAIPQYGNAAIPQNISAAMLQSSNEAREKATFYLAPGQLEKLDDLAHGYRKRTGRRVNRNEIIRFLIDKAELETLLAEW